MGRSAVEWMGAHGTLCISNCPKRTRGDAATRSARPPVLPPPPRPPQRRSRHLVSRAGTPRCACVGTASEGPRRCRAAILSVAGPVGSLDLACFRTPPLSPVLSCCPMRSEKGEAPVLAQRCRVRKKRTHRHAPCLSFPRKHTCWGHSIPVGGALAGLD